MTTDLGDDHRHTQDVTTDNDPGDDHRHRR